jgi:hypothetical protein
VGRNRQPRDYDARAFAELDRVNPALELTYLRAGSDPHWERVRRDGHDVTDQPHLWTPYQRARRESFEARVAEYRAAGLLPPQSRP